MPERAASNFLPVVLSRAGVLVGGWCYRTPIVAGFAGMCFLLPTASPR